MKTVEIYFAAMMGLLILSCSQVKKGQEAPNTENTSNVQPPEAAALTKDAAMRETIIGIVKAYQAKFIHTKLSKNSPLRSGEFECLGSRV